ncbi:chemotaxis protein CheB [uncultured Aquincola sp.]|mgnify:FL=1|uniref:chemotaxis protein CheB n=1 Tax=uncultured Aquincola sp. TaxID=886556 RepID=UPI0032B2AA2D|tara:strand:+ start:369 stop:956 length:588 start_codon:yes stop_codon:yes gene_type:complete
MSSDTLPFRPEAVVIGASAGGVQALQLLLGALPASFPAVVAVVLHLPPDRPSGLAALLAAGCALPVEEAIDKQPLRPGSVVVAPPDYHLLVEPDRRVALSVDEPLLYSRPAIDPLFESAALAYGRGLLGIVLTGASRDGSAGLAAVRRQGGQAWVESPSTAIVSTMPAAALAHAGADLVAPLPELGARLGALAHA